MNFALRTPTALPLAMASRAAAALIAVTLLLAACGSSGQSPDPTASVGANPAATFTTSSAAPTTSGAAAPAPSSSGPALGLQRDFISVVQTVSPSVVVIENSEGLGSGIIFDSTGDIVTNAHVTTGSTTYTVTLADGRQFKGTLVGSFAANDLAVVHINATNLPAATFADSSQLVVGDIVLAVGNPLGLQSSVSEGIVSALGRTVPESATVTLPNVIQTSAPINPGNSGGALVNLEGQVVGIPTLGASDPQMGGAAVGIGFAIPSNVVTDIAAQLIKYGEVVNSGRATLGRQRGRHLDGSRRPGPRRDGRRSGRQGRHHRR